MKSGAAVPVLSCAETKALEARLFAGGESAEWPAMQAAGRAVARAVLEDFEEIGGFPAGGRILVVAGKGHNGGDALLAAAHLLARHPEACADVLFVYGVRTLRPLALRAWQQLQHAFGGRVDQVNLRSIGDRYALGLDGLFGFQFHPPLDERSVAALRRINALPLQLRAAVDLPSGLDAKDAFQADFSYATGVVKTPLLDLPNAGRLRYLDLGFFGGDNVTAAEEGGARWPQRAEGLPVAKGGSVLGTSHSACEPSSREDRFDAATDWVVTSRALDPLRGWREPRGDKRHQGHLFVVAGSRHYPGAALMSVQAALRSGAGLVTAFVPESLVPNFAAQVPEAIWVGWPETPEGGLALEGRHLLQERLPRANALVLGPGLGRERETLALAVDIVKSVAVPVLVDADALQPEVIAAARAPLVLTPHAGEFERIASGKSLRDFAATVKSTVVLKGPVTRICAGAGVYHSFFGGPVLARGGSGDLLAGIIGTQLAQTPADPPAAASRGVVWHGLAADALARAHGAVAVRTTQVLDFLGPTLRL